MSELKEVTIPPEIHVSCPLKQHHLVSARRCDTCPHFHGLQQLMDDPKNIKPFQHVYAVRCAFPIPRQLSYVERDA